MFGTHIPGLEIDGKPAPYGVVNEREVRAASGLMFAIGFFTLLSMYHERNLWLAFGVVGLFWIDFVLKVIFGPGASIFGRIGAVLVGNQKPEYVGAIQKRFAWGIGLAMSSIVFAIVSWQLFFAERCGAGLFGPESSCVLPMVLCGTCLVFMWLESAVGFCVGCTIYAWLVKRGVINSPKFAPVCPGGVCEVKK